MIVRQREIGMEDKQYSKTLSKESLTNYQKAETSFCLRVEGEELTTRTTDDSRERRERRLRSDCFGREGIPSPFILDGAGREREEEWEWAGTSDSSFLFYRISHVPSKVTR